MKCASAGFASFILHASLLGAFWYFIPVEDPPLPLQSPDPLNMVFIPSQENQKEKPAPRPQKHISKPIQSVQKSAISPPSENAVSFVPASLTGIENPSPPYPRRARREGLEGDVVIKVAIDERGRACAVDLDQTSGYACLDEAALTTLAKWHFTPARAFKQPIKSELVVNIHFRLETI